MSPSTGSKSRSLPADVNRKESVFRQRYWLWIKRIVTVVFFLVVATLIFKHAREINWPEVWAAIRQRSINQLLMTGLICLASFALYSCFDLIGRHVTKHHLKAWQVIKINFVSYAFNLNLGSLIGGMGFRYRLYTRLGLTAEMAVRIFVLSMLTNWIGYLLLAGLVFWHQALPLPEDWRVDPAILQYFGLIVFVFACGYPLLCAWSRGRKWVIGKRELFLPSWKVALLQLLMSTTNWMLIAAVLYLLLEQKFPYLLVLEVFLISSVAGVIAHIPGGLGVIETVFVALLGQYMSKSELLASLLVFRALYYLIPLAIATVVYFLFEISSKRAKLD